tara:strand:- start:220 stop:447 length:228 start_codon:yes stop_codon:yes gene_type:complete
MSKMHIRWIKQALENGPLTASQIMDRMTWRRSCPTMNELGNYLSKWSEFEKAPKEIQQHYMCGGVSYVALWRLRK